MVDLALRNRSLRSVTRGAVLFLVGLGVMNAVGFVLTLVLTRHLGAEGYGIYAYTLGIIGMLLMLTTLGGDTSILKYLPEFEHDRGRQRSILGLAYLTSLVGGFVIAAAVYVGAPLVDAYTLNEPVFVDILRLFAVVVVFRSLARMINSTFRGLELLEYEVLINKVFRPVINLGCVAVALALGVSLYGVMVALVVASVGGFGVAVYLLLTRVSLRPSLRGLGTDHEEIIEYYNFSVPLTLNGAGQFLKNRVDILLVGLVLSSTAVGVYNIALFMASALMIPLVAFNQLFPPVASRLHSTGRTAELNAVYGIVTRWSFTVSLIMAGVVAVYRRELLAIFGPGFVAGAAVLVLILGGQLVNSATGPTDYLLMMTGHQYVTLFNKVFFGLLNLVLTLYGLVRFGLVGAGLATFLVLVMFNLAMLWQIWYLERLYPYKLGFLKPIVAAGGAAVAMSGLATVLVGLPLVVVGAAAGVLVYALLLVAMGIEPADRQFFGRLLRERRVGGLQPVAARAGELSD